MENGYVMVHAIFQAWCCQFQLHFAFVILKNIPLTKLKISPKQIRYYAYIMIDLIVRPKIELMRKYDFLKITNESNAMYATAKKENI